MEIGEGVAHDSPEPARDKKPINVRVSLFFDGTGNNRLNTQYREQHPRHYWWWAAANLSMLGTTGSYENDYSNVSRLEENLGDDAEGYTRFIRVYTEGIGTSDGALDDVAGLAFGRGFTGIPSKVVKGIGTALATLEKLYNPADYFIERFTVDSCGFSRGAAAARHCIHRVLNDEKHRLQVQLETQGWDVRQVDVLAVGLFDTVSSYGRNHDDDVSQLNLDAVRQAAAVYQLAAAEEYRENFSLTNIASAGGKGRQVYLPGAHSDIGGGYVDGAGESQRLVRGSYSRDVASFMIARGWYRVDGPSPELRYFAGMSGSDLAYANPYGGPSPDVPPQVDVKRAAISRAYTFIPLHLMARFFEKHALQIRPRLYSFNDPTGVPGRERIEQYANSVGVSKHTDWDEHADAELKELRHGYLHVSFHDDGIGMKVQVARLPSSNPPCFRPHRRVYVG